MAFQIVFGNSRKVVEGIAQDTYLGTWERSSHDHDRTGLIPECLWCLCPAGVHLAISILFLFGTRGMVPDLPLCRALARRGFSTCAVNGPVLNGRATY